jgi:transcriptional regulator of acetoin/glycerol metabolism
MREALEATGGEIKAAAESINMPTSRFYRRLSEFDIRVVHGKPNHQARPKRRDITKAIEKLKTRLVREALKTANGDLTRAARSLGIGRSTLYRVRKATTL